MQRGNGSDLPQKASSNNMGQQQQDNERSATRQNPSQSVGINGFQGAVFGRDASALRPDRERHEGNVFEESKMMSSGALGNSGASTTNSLSRETIRLESLVGGDVRRGDMLANFNLSSQQLNQQQQQQLQLQQLQRGANNIPASLLFQGNTLDQQRANSLRGPQDSTMLGLHSMGASGSGQNPRDASGTSTSMGNDRGRFTGSIAPPLGGASSMNMESMSTEELIRQYQRLNQLQSQSNAGSPNRRSVDSNSLLGSQATPNLTMSLHGNQQALGPTSMGLQSNSSVRGNNNAEPRGINQLGMGALNAQMPRNTQLDELLLRQQLMSEHIFRQQQQLQQQLQQPPPNAQHLLAQEIARQQQHQQATQFQFSALGGNLSGFGQRSVMQNPFLGHQQSQIWGGNSIGGAQNPGPASDMLFARHGPPNADELGTLPPPSLSQDARGFLSESDYEKYIADRDDADGKPKKLPVLLALHEDHMKLSTHQVLLRYQIEAFCATEDDITTHTRGRNKPVQLGQVGIRCRHCAHLPVSKRQKGSTYFPAALLGLYQAAQNMSTTHMQCGLCSEMPTDLKRQFAHLICTKVASSGAGRPYWARAAKKLGLVDTDEGIRFIRNVDPSMITNLETVAVSGGRKTSGSAVTKSARQSDSKPSSVNASSGAPKRSLSSESDGGRSSKKGKKSDDKESK